MTSGIVNKYCVSGLLKVCICVCEHLYVYICMCECGCSYIYIFVYVCVRVELLHSLFNGSQFPFNPNEHSYSNNTANGCCEQDTSNKAPNGSSHTNTGACMACVVMKGGHIYLNALALQRTSINSLEALCSLKSLPR